MNNEPKNIEELLEILVAFSEGAADRKTIDKVRSLAEQLKANPDYNQLKALDHTIRIIFDKIYEKCPAPKPNYTVLGHGIVLEDGHFIGYATDRRIEIHKDGTCFATYNCKDTESAQLLKNHICQQLVSRTFVLKDFLAELNQAALPLTYDSVKKIVSKEDIFLIPKAT